ncbi:hypothetical protein RM555_19720 [Micromonospora sp. DSM 115977]|uniref:Uncharacterized protein n=1 Tax=Micromonospora reichwaldensis TaxID=3075516 RepID=A0ABU2X040_9ACTN|nr:hypothetical protein [Micromonospora sp. DSM 115977]MDT0531219.1 hypothetical protein [Micromonospora sp. DSM 115977]
MTSPTQPERQVEEDLTQQGYPETDPTCRGQAEDIEAEAELKAGPFQGKFRLRDGAGKTASSWSHLLEVASVLVWPAGVTLLLWLAGAPVVVRVWAMAVVTVVSLAVYGLRVWTARRGRREE